MAAFFLVRFRLHEASRQEVNAEQHTDHKPGKIDQASGSASEKTSQLGDAPIWSSNPRLEQVGPFRRGNPPTHLLEICHTLCMIFSVLGFILAMVGVLCYAWAMLPVSSQVLCTVSIGVCLSASVIAIFLPQNISVFAPIHVVDVSGKSP